MSVKVISVGDIIKIHEDAKVNPQLQGKQAEVTEVRAWGVCADIPTLEGAVYPVRLSRDDFDMCGEV